MPQLLLEHRQSIMQKKCILSNYRYTHAFYAAGGGGYVKTCSAFLKLALAYFAIT